jgi:hypothetical protein
MKVHSAARERRQLGQLDVARLASRQYGRNPAATHTMKHTTFNTTARLCLCQSRWRPAVDALPFSCYSTVKASRTFVARGPGSRPRLSSTTQDFIFFSHHCLLQLRSTTAAAGAAAGAAAVAAPVAAAHMPASACPITAGRCRPIGAALHLPSHREDTCSGRRHGCSEHPLVQQ